METTPTHSQNNDELDPFLGAQIEVMDEVSLADNFNPLSPMTLQNVHFDSNGGFELPTMDFHSSESEFNFSTDEGTLHFSSTSPDLEHDEFMTIDGSRETLIQQNKGNKSPRPFKKLSFNSNVRQRLFKTGWEDIKRRIAVMNVRTGTTTIAHATFENAIYTESTSKTNNLHFLVSKSRLKNNETAELEASVVEDDHPYAAVILKQKEDSPSVHDHQYNQKSVNRKDNDDGFIMQRNKRERQLVRYLTSLFSNKQNLEQNVGATITISVSYEHLTFDSKTYKRAETLLAENRKNISIRPYSSDKPNAPATTIFQSQQPEQLSSNVPTFRPFNAFPELLTLDHNYYDSLNYSNSTNQESSLSSLLDQEYDPLNIEDGENNLLQENIETENPPALISISYNCIEQKNKTDATTNTEPTCEICRSQEISSSPEEFMWLRCFNPLCHYLVHLNCVGFKVNSVSQLMMLPPYFCPEHR